MNSPPKTRPPPHRRIARLLVLAAVVLTVTLERVGLPGPWMAPLLRRARMNDLLRVERVRWGPLAGLRASGISARVATPNGMIELRAVEARLRMRWRDSMRHRTLIWEGGILNGLAVWQPPEWEIEPVQLQQLHLNVVRASTNTLEVAASGRWNQTVVRWDGRLVGWPAILLHPATRTAARGRVSPAGPPHAVAPPLLPRPVGAGVLRLYGEMSLDTPRNARLRFDGEGHDLHWAGRTWTGWRIAGEVGPDGLQLEDLTLTAAEDRVRVRGRWAARRQPPELSISARLSPAAIRALYIPDEWRAEYDRWSSAVLGPLRVDLTVGVRPDGSTGLHHLQLEADTVSPFGLTVRLLQGDAVFDGQRWHVRRLLAQLGNGSSAGPVAANGVFEPVSGRYQLRAETAVDPAVLRPLLGGVPALHLGSFRTLGAPPRVHVEAQGLLTDPATIRAEGALAATHFTWNGAYCSSASARFRVADSVLSFDDILVLRPDGRMDGRIEQDLDRKLLRFEVRGTMPIPSLARFAGPRPHLLASQFRLDGRATISARGQVDYGRHDDNWGDLHLEADHVGYGWLDVQSVRLDAEVAGRNIQLHSGAATAFRGSITGAARLSLPETADTPVAYELDMHVSDLSFADVLRALTDREAQTQRGRLSGALRLSGRIGRGQGRTAVGEGRVRIRRGELLDIPIFGGLSRHLSAIVPGLGFVSQGDFRAEFLIRDGYIETERAELRGDVLSLEGAGRYYFDRRLRFRVEARLLRGGAVADVLRLLTSPVTRLLEFDLGGTLDQPEWTPRNLPRL